MGKFTTGFLGGLGAAWLWAYRDEEAFHQVMFYLLVTFLALVVIVIIYGTWEEYRDREAIRKEREQFEAERVKADEEREAWVRRHAQNVKAGSAREKQALLIERNDLILKNARLIAALRAKWGKHLNNIAVNNPGRAKRMGRKTDQFISNNQHGREVKRRDEL